MFNKIDNFYDFLYAFLYVRSFLKGVYAKRKEFAPNAEQILAFKS